MTAAGDCFARISWAGTRRIHAAFFVTSTGGDSVSGLDAGEASSNWRCLAVGKLSAVELIDGRWHTAPNHSHPQSCIVRVEMDVEDYPGGDPQNGQ